MGVCAGMVKRREEKTGKFLRSQAIHSTHASTIKYQVRRAVRAFHKSDIYNSFARRMNSILQFILTARFLESVF